jgi:hypothetical protein
MLNATSTFHLNPWSCGSLSYRASIDQSPACCGRLQATGKQAAANKPISSIALGDKRLNPFCTSYRNDFEAPFEDGKLIRSPLRNKTLQDVALRDIYNSAFKRVGE